MSPSTTPEPWSARCWPRGSGTAASPRGWRRRCLRRWCTTPRATRSPPRWWTTPSSLPPSCPASSCWPARPPRPSTRWGSGGSARPERSAPPRPRRTPSSTRSATSASATSTCRPRRPGSGPRSAQRERAGGASECHHDRQRRPDRGRGAGPHPAGAFPARRGRPHRGQRRLRHQFLRGVHGAAGRAGGEVVHPAGRRGGRFGGESDSDREAARVIPAPFTYQRAGSADEALDLAAGGGEDAKFLAGGHSLLPLMKLRLAVPEILIDIGRLRELRYVRDDDGHIAVGALSTHHDLATSGLLDRELPLLP